MIYKITKFIFFIPNFFIHSFVRSLLIVNHPLVITITKLYHLMFTIYFLFLSLLFINIKQVCSYMNLCPAI